MGGAGVRRLRRWLVKWLCKFELRRCASCREIYRLMREGRR